MSISECTRNQVLCTLVYSWNSTYCYPFIHISLCSGAEHLLQLVRGAIPQVYFESTSSIPHADIIVHVLDYLYKKLDQICLVQGGEVVITYSVTV